MGGQAQPIVVEIVGGGKVVDTEAMSPSVRQSYFDALARGDALYDTNEAGARAAWSEADRIAEPYTRPVRPRPTAPVPHPPELIPESSEAIAVCTSPDVCRSPSAPVPYMVWGKGDDDDNYSPDVFSNGQRIKRADSRFTATYGDEPGTGLGVKSGTVGNVVEPVTSSAIVRANGIPIQRHTDTCTLNNGNCPGEYIHVQSTETTPAPDGQDEGDQTPADVALGEAEKARKGFYENSSEAQAIVGAWNRAGDYIGDPSLIGQDLQRARDAIPTTDEVVQFGRDAATGAGNLAEYVAENPVQSAKNVWNWGVDGVTGLWNGVEGAYQEGGISQAGGHLAAAGLSLVNPFKKAKAVGEGVDALGDLGRVGGRRDGDDGNDGDGPDVPPRPTPDQNDDRRDEEDGGNGARSTRARVPKVRRDRYGRIISWDDTIWPDDIGRGTPTNQAARDYARSLGLSTDDAGHARGSLLGGSGTDTDNIFPQAPSINRGQFRVFERNLADQITATGGPANIRIEPSYVGSSTRPSQIRYDATLSDGRSISRIFPNP